jgi:solute carrier family 25 phosphate transporter 3
MTPEQKESLSPVANFGITLSSGIVAGFAAAILSHVSFTLTFAGCDSWGQQLTC